MYTCTHESSHVAWLMASSMIMWFVIGPDSVDGTWHNNMMLHI